MLGYRSVLTTLACALVVLVSTPGDVSAKTRIENKLFQFGGPETRGKCVKELKTKGVPVCRAKGFKIKCKQPWVKTCIGAKVEFKQHEFFLVVTGPDLNNAAEQALREATEKALAAGVAAAAAAPGEASAKIAAGYAVFYKTLMTLLAAEPLLASVKDKFKIAITEKGHWPNTPTSSSVAPASPPHRRRARRLRRLLALHRHRARRLRRLLALHRHRARRLRRLLALHQRRARRLRRLLALHRRLVEQAPPRLLRRHLVERHHERAAA